MYQISVKPGKIAYYLGVVACVLIIASIGMQLMVHLTGHQTILGLARLFDLNEEQNLPTFFSTCLLVFAALLLAMITLLKKRQAASQLWHWVVLTVGFVYLAIDEATVIHEWWPVRRFFGDTGLGIFYYPWVIPGILIVIVLALFLRPFLLTLPAKTRSRFLLAAILYVGGALGMELIEGTYNKSHSVDWVFKAMFTIEETLEMAGIILFIWALLHYLARDYQEVRFSFEGVNRGSSAPSTDE
jgi:hypothetical protein